MTIHMKTVKKLERSTDMAVPSPVEEEYYPTVYLSDVPLPDEDVGSKIFIKIQGKIIGKSESRHGSSVDIEMHKIGFETDENEFTELSRDED